MSLIKRSPISARQRASNRSNARKSTGPRSIEGKNHSRLNGLKHGLCAQPFRRVMSELGEDPQEFDRFHQGLRESTEPANTLEAQLTEDLAVLWWKKRRSERAQGGVQAYEVERVKGARRRQRYEAERLGIEQRAEEAEEVGLWRAKDCRGKFQMVLDTLDALAARLERNRDWEDWPDALRLVYGARPTVSGSILRNLFCQLQAAPQEPCADLPGPDSQASGDEPDGRAGEGSGLQKGADGGQQAAEASGVKKPPPPSLSFTLRATLVRYLLEERQAAAREFELFRQEQGEMSEAARDACLAPTDARWTWILRQENYLDRQIERKIRLLDLLQEKRRRRQAAAEADDADETPTPPPNNTKMKIQTLQVVEKTENRPGDRLRKDRKAPPQRRAVGIKTSQHAPSG